MESRMTLYQCSFARILGEMSPPEFHHLGKLGETIYCAQGKKLDRKGVVHIRRLARGSPLSYNICQNCEACVYMGEPLLEDERGWLHE